MGYLPNGNSKGWLHESNKYVRTMTFIEAQVLRFQKEKDEEYGRQQRTANSS